MLKSLKKVREYFVYFFSKIVVKCEIDKVNQ